MVMPSNNTCWVVHCWACWYAGTIGHLYTPARAERAFPHIPYALESGMWPYRDNPSDWPEEKYLNLLDWAATQCRQPRWVLVPDVVFHWKPTVDRWNEWAPRVKAYGWPLAIAVQDGATPAEVRSLAIQPDVIFVGGSTDKGSLAGWKWETLPDWTGAFDRVHVGRVNWRTQLDRCKELGVESVDGSGWFRGNVRQIRHLEEFLRDETGAVEHPLIADASRRGAARKSGQEVMFRV